MQIWKKFAVYELKLLLLLFLNKFRHATPKNKNKNNFAFICCKFFANLSKFSEIQWLKYWKKISMRLSYDILLLSAPKSCWVYFEKLKMLDFDNTHIKFCVSRWTWQIWNIWKKNTTKSILVINLNSGFSYLTTTVLDWHVDSKLMNLSQQGGGASERGRSTWF